MTSPLSGPPKMPEWIVCYRYCQRILQARLSDLGRFEWLCEECPRTCSPWAGRDASFAMHSGLPSAVSSPREGCCIAGHTLGGQFPRTMTTQALTPLSRSAA